MKVSDKGLAELISHEALVTSPYKDSVGVWTIGVGHTSGAGLPYPATMPKGEAKPVSELVDLFRRDLAKYEAAVEKAVTVPLKPHEFDALVSFHFNTGAIARATFVKKLNAGDKAGAAKGMMDWNKPAEIIERRTKEMKLFRDGTYSNDGKATIYPASVNGAVQWGKGKRVAVADLIGKPVLVTGTAGTPQGGAQSAIGNPISEQNQGVEVMPGSDPSMANCAKIAQVQSDPPPAVIVSDEPTKRPGILAAIGSLIVYLIKGK